MGSRLLALVGAAAAGFVAVPGLAQEIERPATTTFYMAIPLDSRTATPSFGLQFQGSRPYQFLKFDSQTFRTLPAAWSTIEAKLSGIDSQRDRPARPCLVDCAAQK